MACHVTSRRDTIYLLFTYSFRFTLDLSDETPLTAPQVILEALGTLAPPTSRRHYSATTDFPRYSVDRTRCLRVHHRTSNIYHLRQQSCGLLPPANVRRSASLVMASRRVEKIRNVRFLVDPAI